MKSKSKLLLVILTAVTLFTLPKTNFGQVITLGQDASRFVLFTSSGAVGDNASAHSNITGDVGTLTPGPITGFGNIDGIMHPGVDPATTACEIALQATIAQINSNPATLVGPLSLGSGATLTPGIYSIPGNATLTLDLILDGQGNPNAEFVFKVAGTFSTNTLSRVKLINGALACHVFWKIDGSVTMASLSTMRGNIISGGLIQMGSGDSLEGRAFSTPAGAITIDGITARTPIGCGSQFLTGPPLPDLASLYCYTIFASIGALDGNLSSTSIGDVGNAGGGSVTGWTAGNVTGALHLTGDPSTMLAATDLTNVYNTLNAMIPDIELLYPVEFGHNLVLTPHVYLMLSGGPTGPATLNDSVYLDAQGNPNAVFVIKITGGGLTTTVNSRINLINGAQAKNVFWMIDGAVEISDNSIFRGNIIVSAGALNLRYSGVVLDGRALTINGAITTAGLAAAMPPGCGIIPCSPQITTEPNDTTVCTGDSALFSVAATGTGLTYQWRKGTVDILGATNDTLIIFPVSISDAALDYNVVISGTCAPNDTSINVSLTVNAAPIIITEPVNQTACVGDSVSFTVAASGTGLTFQWRKGIVNIIGETNDTLTIDPVSITDAALNYNVVVTGTCSSDTSTFVSLILNNAPVIITEPLNQTACVGDSVSFTVAATGTGLTYQWRIGIVAIIGETNDTLTIDPVSITDAALNYNVVVMGACANDTSINVSLTVNEAPIITTQPTDQTVCEGDSVSFSVIATGTGLTYQWRKGTVAIIGETFTTFTINPASVTDAASDYNVVITGTCSSDTSINVSLIVNALPIAVATSNSPVCADSPINLAAQTILGGTYLWTGPNAFLSSDQNPVILSATPSYAGNYSLIVSANGCTSAPASVSVIVKICLFIPEGFSPNGDGINDVFVIRGIEYYPENTFEIFNRWGNKVFEANPYLSTWDGKSTMGLRIGGDELPVGTYFYVLDLGDGSDIYKGTIYLNR
jgi:gliding motility-associated-like protein